MFKNIFENITYPILLDTFDELKIKAFPPWELLNQNHRFWKQLFDDVKLLEYFPFAKMINDDVIATFKNNKEEIYLFN